MSYVKKRIPRKKTSDPDEIVSYSRRMMDLAEENINKIIYGGGAVLLAAVIVLGMMWVKANRTDAAREALARSLNLYFIETRTDAPSEDGGQRVPDLSVPLEAFRDTAEEYRGTAQGDFASFYTANLLFRTGRYGEAAEEVRSLIDREPAFAAGVNAEVLLARILETAEKYGEAAEIYGRQASGKAGDMRAMLMIDAARCFELSGDRDRAVDLYRSVVEEFGETSFGVRADTKLAILGVRMDKSL